MRRIQVKQSGSGAGVTIGAVRIDECDTVAMTRVGEAAAFVSERKGIGKSHRADERDRAQWLRDTRELLVQEGEIKAGVVGHQDAALQQPAHTGCDGGKGGSAGEV